MFCLSGIRANPGSGAQGFLGGINSAILRYSGAPIADPGFSLVGPLSLSPLRETNLHVRDLLNVFLFKV